MIKGTKQGLMIGAAGACLLLAGACAPVQPPAPPRLGDRSASRMPDIRAAQNADAQNADARAVGDVLARGLNARTRGDGEALYDAALALQDLGAHAEDGGDLARQWMGEAALLGARHPVRAVFRGRTLGPGYRQGRVGANAHFVTHQSFNAGQRAEIVLVPLDDAPLSLDVVDDEGSRICSVAPSTRNLGCRWVPTFTGRSDIDVTNGNNRPVAFYIVLN